MREDFIIQTEEYKGYKIELIQDNDAEDPRRWDNMGTMVCFHKRYSLGDKTDYKSEDYNSWEELEIAIRQNEKTDYILPIYMYDHSGITISTSPFSCPWDSGRIGFIFATKDAVNASGAKYDESIYQILNSEIKTYDAYLRGDVVGMSITKETTCNECEHSHTEVIDSCWGFFPDEDGHFTYVIDEAKATIDNLPL